MSNNRLNRRNISGITSNFSFLPQITNRTNEQFLEEIRKIHENQYTPIHHIPTVFGRDLCLLTLYNAVAKRGGFKKMNTERSWEGVLSDLKMPIKCANGSVALRSIFQRYLEPFERLQRNKATINEIEEELQMESDNRYRTAAQRTTLSHCNFNTTGMIYRTDTHLISPHKRQDAGLSSDLSDVVEFKKLELSLKSGLVNEIEFSLNTILLMSFQVDGVQLCRNPRLLDLALNCIGIGDLELLRDLSQHDRSTRRFLQFWNENVIIHEGRKFLLPDIFDIEDYESPVSEKLNELFKLNDELTIYDKEGQRIQLVMTIIRNLALHTLNCRFITQNPQCMRLIILCCYASHFALRQIGLEVLSMLSFPVVGILSETLRQLLIDLIDSEDRVERLRGLEIITHLSDPKVCIDNTEFLSGLPKQLFVSLISMLIIHDLHIVVLALEAVYGLSEVDSYLCIKMVECSSEILSTLYILLSLEAQVMGTQSLIRIRVMQGPGGVKNQMPLNRLGVQQPDTSHMQLATSLMPPPPVPTNKIATTTVPIIHTFYNKPQFSATADSVNGTQNKPQITQKIFPVSIKSNTLCPPLNTNPPNLTSSIVKSELTTVSSVSLISSEIVDQNTANMVSGHNLQTLDSNPDPPAVVNHPVVTISPMYANNLQHISTVNEPTISKVSTPLTTTEPSLNGAITKQFTNKQDFVTNWLLSNYVESSQCTVPLFAMYKQLQVAVQNYFKDSEMVTAEEFHKLVRILFPEVQLVQLHTPLGTVEIHYYNLKISPKTFVTESSVLNCQQSIAHSTDDVAIVNNGQPNCPQRKEELSNDQKLSKRHASEMVNGYFIEDGPNKRPRTNSECNHTPSNHSSSNQTNDINCKVRKEEHSNNIVPNGVITKHHQNEENNQIAHFDERHCQSYLNAHPNQIFNGSVVEDLKHSDSETRAFSSSTVSPMHCESLANGTDGSSEGTMDSDLGRVIANIPTMTQTQAPLSNCSSTARQEPTSTKSTIQCEATVGKRNTKKNNFNQLGRTRSRFRNNNPPSKVKQRTSSSQRPHNLAYLYICEWDNCLQSFDKPQKVYGHVYTNHFMTLRTEVESKCFWSNCTDTTQRTPLPLLNHVNEQHCNNVALEAARQIRLTREKEKSIVTTSESIVIKQEPETVPKLLNFCSAKPTAMQSVPVQIQSPLSHSLPKPPHISSTISTVLDTTTPLTKEPTTIISSQSTESLSTMTVSTPVVQPNTSVVPVTSPTPVPVTNIPQQATPETNVSFITSSNIPVSTTSGISSTQPSSTLPSSIKNILKEGPVTKHIRFLSALILRNLCQCSSDARRFVAARHQPIFELSISGCESARALSECLYYSSIEITGNNRQQK